MNTAITTNFRGETFAEARQQLVNVLKAQKSWVTGYAESYVDEFADMATTRPTPEAQEARDAVQWAHDEFEDKEHVARVRGDIWLADYYGVCKAKMAAALALPAQGEGNRG